MYSYEEKIKAVNLLIKYHMAYTATIRELGYPHVNMLRRWYKEYEMNQDLRKTHPANHKYSDEKVETAINYYLEHGENITKTVNHLGYPCKYTLRKWLNNRFPDRKRLYTKSKIDVECKETIKKAVTIKSHMLNKKETKTDLAKEYEISRTTLYNWNKKLLGDEYMNRKTKDFSNMEDINELKSEIEKLKKSANC